MRMFGWMWVVATMVSLVSVVGAEQPAAGNSGGTTDAMSASAAQKLTVEAKLGTGLEKYDVIGEAESFDAGVGKIVGWTRVEGAKEPTEITHVWSYKGNEISSIPLSVKAQTFRTWSRKTVTGMPGPWTFQVKDANGEILATKNFEVTEQAAAPAVPAVQK